MINFRKPVNIPSTNINAQCVARDSLGFIVDVHVIVSSKSEFSVIVTYNGRIVYSNVVMCVDLKDTIKDTYGVEVSGKNTEGIVANFMEKFALADFEVKNTSNGKIIKHKSIDKTEVIHLEN